MMNPYLILDVANDEDYSRSEQRFFLTKAEVLEEAKKYYLEVINMMKRDGGSTGVYGDQSIYQRYSGDYRDFYSVMQLMLTEASLIYRWNENVHNMGYLQYEIANDFEGWLKVPKEKKLYHNGLTTFCDYATPNQELQMIDAFIAAYKKEEEGGWFDAYLHVPFYDRIRDDGNMHNKDNSSYEIYEHFYNLYKEKVNNDGLNIVWQGR